MGKLASINRLHANRLLTDAARKFPRDGEVITTATLRMQREDRVLLALLKMNGLRCLAGLRIETAGFGIAFNLGDLDQCRGIF